MLQLLAPALLNGTLLEQDLASAGMPTGVYVSGDYVHLVELDEPQRVAAQGIVDQHPAKAQALADANAAAANNESTIRQRADSALATNTTFLGIASPTNAQIAAQVKALTRQNNGLIRLALRRFDSAD